MTKKEGTPTLAEWLQEVNGRLRSGSRVLCDWVAMLTPQSAPACFKDGVQTHVPGLRYEQARVHLSDGRPFVRVDVQPLSLTNPRLQARVWLEHAQIGSYLVLDDLELATIPASHDGATEHQAWYSLLVNARQVMIREARQVQQCVDALDAMTKVLPDEIAASISSEMIAFSVRRWRHRENGALPPGPTSEQFGDWSRQMLDSLVRQQNATAPVIDLAERMGRSMSRDPLRAQLNAAGRVELWLTVPVDERDERLGPWVWAERWMFKVGRDGLWRKDTSRPTARDVLPASPSHAVSLIHEWPAARRWQGLHAAGGLSPGQREQLIELIDRSAAEWTTPEAPWGNPDEVFGAVVIRGKQALPALAARLVGAVYRPSIGDIVAIMAVQSAPVLFSHHRGSRATRAAIERWASGRDLSLSRKEPPVEISAISGLRALRLFRDGSVIHTRGKPRSIAANEHLSAIRSSLALDDPEAVRYVPAVFDRWLAG